MAQHKSAKKRIRQTQRRTLRNKLKRSAAKSAVKKVRMAIVEKKKDEALKLLPRVQSLLDRLSKTNVIAPNTAARYTSRLARQIDSL